MGKAEGDDRRKGRKEENGVRMLALRCSLIRALTPGSGLRTMKLMDERCLDVKECNAMTVVCSLVLLVCLLALFLPPSLFNLGHAIVGRFTLFQNC